MWFSSPFLHLLLGSQLSEETQLSFHFSIFSYSWLEETLPAWGSHLLTVVRPGLQLAWKHTSATVSFLSAHCASHLAWFGDSLTSLSQRVSQRQGGQKGGSPQGLSYWEGAAPHELGLQGQDAFPGHSNPVPPPWSGYRSSSLTP